MLGPEQSRTHNTANEIAAIGPAADYDPAHDRAGNMIEMSKPGDPTDHYDLDVDAWNRLVEMPTDGDSTAVAQYAYDGRNFRSSRKTYVSGQLDETRHFYYSPHGRCWRSGSDDETPTASTCGASATSTTWCSATATPKVTAARAASASESSGLEERLYALADPNYNVVAIPTSRASSSSGSSTTPTARPRRRAGLSSYTGGDYAWQYLFTTRPRDETGLMYYRNRDYHPQLGGFVTRDPLGADFNLYRYVHGNPLLLTDPLGLDSGITGPCEIKIWAGDTLYSGKSLDNFLTRTKTQAIILFARPSTSVLWGAGLLFPTKSRTINRFPVSLPCRHFCRRRT